MTLVEAAAEYLTAGLSVIALAGKQPAAWWHPHGLHSALSGKPDSDQDIELLNRIFSVDPSVTGIGIVIPDFLVVVDIDGEEGAAAWQRRAESKGFNFIPDTPVASTGRGLHIYYMTTAQLSSGPLAPMLDLKALGGYVCAPPSVHPSGRVYEWLTPLVSGGKIVNMDWLPYG
jgi:hypothetical protein